MENSKIAKKKILKKNLNTRMSGKGTVRRKIKKKVI